YRRTQFTLGIQDVTEVTYSYISSSSTRGRRCRLLLRARVFTLEHHHGRTYRRYIVLVEPDASPNRYGAYRDRNNRLRGSVCTVELYCWECSCHRHLSPAPRPHSFRIRHCSLD